MECQPLFDTPQNALKNPAKAIQLHIVYQIGPICRFYKGKKDLLIEVQREADIFPHQRNTIIALQIQKQNVIISIKANVVCAPHDELNQNRCKSCRYT